MSKVELVGKHRTCLGDRASTLGGAQSVGLCILGIGGEAEKQVGARALNLG